MFCVRKPYRWRSLVCAGQTRRLDYPALLFAVHSTLLRPKAPGAPPSGISRGASVHDVATPVRRAFQSVLIINSVVCEFSSWVNSFLEKQILKSAHGDD